eukprot:c23550_g1_i2 orf=361-1887(-)
MAMEIDEHVRMKGRLTPYALFTCLMASTGGLMNGYDLVVAGGVSSMNDFLEKFYPSVLKNKENAKHDNYCKYNSQELQMYSSVLYLAALVSASVASHVTRLHGRKVSMLIAGLFCDVGTIMGSAAQNLTMLIFGRVLLGFGIGFVIQVVPLFLSEMAPPHARGSLNLLFALNISLGSLIAKIMNYWAAKIHPWGWRLSLGLAALPGLLLTVGSLVVDETPSSLVQRGHLDSAKAVLRKVRGTDQVEMELDNIITASEIARQVETPFRSLLKGRNRPQLVTAIAMPMFQQLSGSDGIFFYGPLLFQTFGFKDDASLYSAVILGVVCLSTVFVSVFTVDKLGRRIQLVAASVQMCIVQVIIAVILAKFMTSSEELPKPLAITLVALICLFLMAFTSSWGPLTWLVTSEIFPMEIRSVGLSVCVWSNMLLKFIIAQSFLSMLCSLKYGIFLIFAGWVAVMGLFALLLLPETKSVPIDEVIMLWRKHWFWKRLGTHTDSLATHERRQHLLTT